MLLVCLCLCVPVLPSDVAADWIVFLSDTLIAVIAVIRVCVCDARWAMSRLEGTV